MVNMKMPRILRHAENSQFARITQARNKYSENSAILLSTWDNDGLKRPAWSNSAWSSLNLSFKALLFRFSAGISDNQENYISGRDVHLSVKMWQDSFCFFRPSLGLWSGHVRRSVGLSVYSSVRPSVFLSVSLLVCPSVWHDLLEILKICILDIVRKQVRKYRNRSKT